MRPRILNLEPEGYSTNALAILQSFSYVESGPCSREELLEWIPRYDAIIVRLSHKIDDEVLDKAKKMKVIASATTGLNHIDCKYAEKLGIKIISLKGETEFLDSVYATAEHTWALILSLLRNIPASVQHVFKYGWDRNTFKGLELYGKTLGIIGYGRLGKKVAHYGIAFGMEVLIYDIRKQQPNGKITFVSLKDLLNKSDIVTLHITHNASTHHFFDNNKISQMKNGSFIINTSRGEVIDEAALLNALKMGRIAGAALDVMCGENISNPRWLQSDPLLEYAKNHSNLIITPHLGGCTFESMEKTEIFIARKIKIHFMSLAV